jgi:hypothetical protein
VEIDTERQRQPIRAGDPVCTLKKDQWHRGILAECNEYFAGRFPYIAAAVVKKRWAAFREAARRKLPNNE